MGNPASQEPGLRLAGSVAGDPRRHGPARGPAPARRARPLHVPGGSRSRGLRRHRGGHSRGSSFRGDATMTQRRSTPDMPEDPSTFDLLARKHREALRHGFHTWPTLQLGMPPALGDPRWTDELILATWQQAETGRAPGDGLEFRVGRSGGGFDRLDFKEVPVEQRLPESAAIDLSIPLNRRGFDREIEIPIPWYGGGMSYGSVSEQVMLSRAMAARQWKTFTSTGEGGYPPSLAAYSESVITQIATGM